MWQALGAIGGGLIGAVGQGIAQHNANKFNAEEALKQRAFQSDEAARQRAWSNNQAADAFTRQKEVMQNQIQWQQEDLKKAGLNPMLALTKGAPTSGGVGIAQGSNAGAGASAVGHSVLGNVSGASEIAKVYREIAGEKANIDATRAMEKKAKMETQVAANSAKAVQLSNKRTEMNMPAFKNQAEADRIKADFNKTNAYSDSWLNRIKSFIPFTGSANVSGDGSIKHTTVKGLAR